MTRIRIWLAAVALAVFVGTLVPLLGHAAWLTAADDAVLAPLFRYGSAHPGWVRGWDVFCTVFHPVVFRAIGWIWIVYALIRRQRRVALFLALSVEASGLLIILFKATVDRPRPATALVSEVSSSYPSGHALGVMAGVLGLTIVALPLLAQAWHKPVIAAGALIVFFIGVGRVVLNVHHLSDVLAGWALGYLWVLACLPVLRPSPVSAAETPEAHDTPR